jgi:pimeloyl-ACP methyl ester carboxylesterase
MSHRRLRRIATLASALLVAGGPLAVTIPAHAGSSADDAPKTVWLCHPDLADNPCDHDLTTTVVRADGSRKIVQAKPARRSKIDCFYVYPTVSSQPTTNADLTIDPEEIAVAEQQASRFSTACRVFAPMYRQITLRGLTRFDELATAAPIAYADVVAAWRDYLEHENKGRGVVFIGHSQGTGMLAQLLAREVDEKKSVRRRVVSALLLGGFIMVPDADGDGGATFDHIPPCEKSTQIGCVVAYSSFNEIPPDDSFFARTRDGRAGVLGYQVRGGEVLCVNPANLTGEGALVPYFRTEAFPGRLGLATQRVDERYDTPWVSFPNLYTARCERAEGAHWLQIDAVGGVDDERPRVQQTLGPRWGLHLVDVNLALGNLVALVRDQAKAYAARP